MVATSRQNYLGVSDQVDRRLLLGGAYVKKWMASSSRTATSGVTRGLPSDRIVDIQNNSAASSIRRVSSNFVATALGTLNRASSVVAGSSINHSFLSSARFPELERRGFDPSTRIS